jgi:hypothetical protein
MCSCLTSDSSSAVPITPVTKASLPQWLEAHPARREWLNVIGFKAEPNSFAFLPPSDGEHTRVLAAVGEGEPIWAFAGLPTSLPEGVYSICRVGRRARHCRRIGVVARFVRFYEVQGTSADSRRHWCGRNTRTNPM